VRPPGAAGQPPAPEVTTTLMQDVAVLATGRQVRAGGDDGSGTRHFTAITVEVSPEQAQRLIVAQRTGKLTAMLRHPDDRQPLGSRVLDLNALLGIAPPAATAAAVAPGPEIFVGGRGALVGTRAPSAGAVAAVPLPEPVGQAAVEAGWSLRHAGAAHAAPPSAGSTAAGATAAGATATSTNAATGHEGKIR
ncbi:MAG TPA: RcpC/CpaB family pilus assembly protein, partial [Zeimonas sp.]|nr:RcpC/CpaB family pilus assembly protein [Zeimonas sp.]